MLSNLLNVLLRLIIADLQGFEQIVQWYNNAEHTNKGHEMMAGEK